MIFRRPRYVAVTLEPSDGHKSGFYPSSDGRL
jgi:hypothetical protein